MTAPAATVASAPSAAARIAAISGLVFAVLFVVALVLAVTNNPIAVLVFPAWVVLISVLLLRHAHRAAVPEPTSDAAGPDTAEALDTSRPSMRSDPS